MWQGLYGNGSNLSFCYLDVGVLNMVQNSMPGIVMIKQTFFKMKNQEKPASFIAKLYNILKSKQHSKAIVWDSEKKGIRIVNQKRLEETVLPRYYRHNRFASFVRQLNMYDFHKIHLGDHKSIFCHQTFDPKDKQTIYVVKRKVTFNLENNDKISSSEDKQLSTGPKDELKSFKALIPSEKQNIWSHGSSFKLVKNSIKLLNDKRSQKMDQVSHISEEEAVEQLVQQIVPLGLESEQMKKKIKKLEKSGIYRKFLRKKEFKKVLYQRLGLQFDEENERLSQLSIEGELLIQTRKTLTQRSLKMFESGPINYRDTVGCLINGSLRGFNNMNL